MFLQQRLSAVNYKYLSYNMVPERDGSSMQSEDQTLVSLYTMKTVDTADAVCYVL